MNEMKKRILKNAANLITISRIILAIPLFISLSSPRIFLCIYLICGFTDFLDGFIARKTHTASILGARLDSFADILMFSAATVYLITQPGLDLYQYLPFIFTVFSIRIINLMIAGIKYHAFIFLHTYGNKIAGFLICITHYYTIFLRTVFISILYALSIFYRLWKKD
jgi:CDP-diacylglycerol--glycerol-3-phosphate 3-phosphatidyltransferase